MVVKLCFVIYCCALCLFLDPVVIRVEKAEDEMLYPNHFSCPMLRVMAKYSQQQFSSRKEFINLVREIQKHTGNSPYWFMVMNLVEETPKGICLNGVICIDNCCCLDRFCQYVVYITVIVQVYA